MVETPPAISRHGRPVGCTAPPEGATVISEPSPRVSMSIFTRSASSRCSSGLFSRRASACERGGSEEYQRR